MVSTGFLCGNIQQPNHRSLFWIPLKPVHSTESGLKLDLDIISTVKSWIHKQGAKHNFITNIGQRNQGETIKKFYSQCSSFVSPVLFLLVYIIQLLGNQVLPANWRSLTLWKQTHGFLQILVSIILKLLLYGNTFWSNPRQAGASVCLFSLKETSA